MARPTTPLISRREACRIALEMIDSEGLAAFSIRRLAAEMNVNAASLYHHFASKDDILVGCAEMVMNELHVPDEHEDWREFALESVLIYRRALLAHPEMTPVVLRQHPMVVAAPKHEQVLDFFVRAGMKPEDAIAMQHTLGSLALGVAMYAQAIARSGDHHEWSGQHPLLADALDESDAPDEDAFRAACEAVIKTFAP